MNNERGFTLTELLVAVAIIALVLSGIVALQQQGQLAYAVGSARAEVQQSGRIALDRMERELRAGVQVTAATNCDNVATGANDITFVYYDSPSDTNITVRYYQNGSNLERVQTAPASDDVLIGGLQTLKLHCYDSNDALTAVPTAIRSVDISLVTKLQGTVASGSAGDQHELLDSRVRLRNLL